MNDRREIFRQRAILIALFVFIAFFGIAQFVMWLE